MSAWTSAASVWPRSSGTATVVLLCESTTMTVLPAEIGVVAIGSCESTVSGSTDSLTS